MKFNAIEVAGSGWNISNQELKRNNNNYLKCVESGFRTIKAVSFEEAIAYMELHYTEIESVMKIEYQLSYKPCHNMDKDYRTFVNADLSEDGILLYSFLVERTPII